MSRKIKVPIPTEHEEQVMLFDWMTASRGRFPALERAFAVPNMGQRSYATANYLAQEGLKSGVPDIFIPAARQGKHGLFLEMKRIEGGKLSMQQSQWIAALIVLGYRVEVCNGFEEAKAVIENYFTKEKPC